MASGAEGASASPMAGRGRVNRASCAPTPKLLFSRKRKIDTSCLVSPPFLCGKKQILVWQGHPVILISSPFNGSSVSLVAWRNRMLYAI